MVAVTAGEVSPIVVGVDLLRRDRGLPGDLRPAPGAGVDGGADRLVRVAAGPRALPRPVPGAPRRDHAAARRLGGRRWSEAQRACERLSQTVGRPWVGPAFYQQAELHRLRGEFARAEEAYRQASHVGREPQPGLALLRLAQGQRRGRGGGDPPRGGRGAGPRRPRQAARRLRRDHARRRRCRRRRGPPPTSWIAIAADLDAPLLRAVGRAGHGRRAPRRGRCPRGPRRAAPGLDGLAGARGAVRRRAGPGPDWRSPAARSGTRTPRRWSSTRRAGSSEQLGAAPDVARVEALAPQGEPPGRRAG